MALLSYGFVWAALLFVIIGILLPWRTSALATTSLTVLADVVSPRPFGVSLTGHERLSGPSKESVTVAQEFEFPFMVALYSMNDNRRLCSGALISPFWVLTVARCLSSPDSTLGNGSRLVIGQSNLNDNVDLLGMSVSSLLGSMVKPANRSSDNLLLIRLRYPINVMPIQLPSTFPRNNLSTLLAYDSSSSMLNKSPLNETTDLCDCSLARLENDNFASLPLDAQGVRNGRYEERVMCSTLISGAPLNIGSPLLSSDGTLAGLSLDDVSSTSGSFFRMLTPDDVTWIIRNTGDLASVGRTETRFTYADPEIWYGLRAPNDDARANRWCSARGYIGGFQMRQLGVDFGVMCFNKTAASTKFAGQGLVKLIVPSEPITSKSRKQAALWAIRMGCSTGAWTGDRRPRVPRQLQMLCLRDKLGDNMLMVSAAKSDLALDATLDPLQQLYDLPGLLFARKNGFQAGIWTGFENKTHVEFVLVGSSYEWSHRPLELNYTSSALKDESPKSECSLNFGQCSLGLETVQVPGAFDDGWSIGYPGNSSRCFLLPSRDQDSLLVLNFLNVNVGEGDEISVFVATMDANNTLELSDVDEPILVLQNTASAIEITTPRPGQSLLIEFKSTTGSQMGYGFSAYASYLIPNVQCSPLLSKAACLKIKGCGWRQNRCASVPTNPPTAKKPSRRPSKRPSRRRTF